MSHVIWNLMSFTALTATACLRWMLLFLATIDHWQKCWLHSVRRKGINVSTIEFILQTACCIARTSLRVWRIPLICTPFPLSHKMFSRPSPSSSFFSFSLFTLQKIQDNRHSPRDSIVSNKNTVKHYCVANKKQEREIHNKKGKKKLELLSLVWCCAFFRCFY